MKKVILALAVLGAGCASKDVVVVEALADAAPAPKATPSPAALKATSGSSTVVISNDTNKDTVVHFAFGADSAITSWTFCPTTARLNCQFPLKAHAKQDLPLDGKYLNTTFSFGGGVSCGNTKGELNLNNPKWANGTIDVSLVDGFNGIIRLTSVDSSGKKVFAPVGKEGNEKAAGVFPLGCDICVARQQPPCGMKPGKSGCHAGTQFAPTPPCQYQTVGAAAIAVSWLGTP